MKSCTTSTYLTRGVIHFTAGAGVVVDLFEAGGGAPGPVLGRLGEAARP